MPENRALSAPYSGRAGVLNRANSALIERWMRDHWGKPANIAQSLAAIARSDAELAQERIQRSHEAARKRREQSRKDRAKCAI